MIFHLGERVKFKYNSTETWYGTVMSPLKDGDYLIGFDKRYHKALHIIDGIENAYWISGSNLEFLSLGKAMSQDTFWTEE